MREIIITLKSGNKIKGLFHGWHSDPNMELNAIVEMPDGSIKLVYYSEIKFLSPPPEPVPDGLQISHGLPVDGQTQFKDYNYYGIPTIRRGTGTGEKP